MKVRYAMWFEKKRSHCTGEKNHTLLFFPYSGGSSDVFDELLSHIREDIDCYVFQLPGMGKRLLEPLRNDVENIVSEAVSEICDIVKQNSFSLYGHSTGGLFAFLFAQSLLSMGLRSNKVFIAAEAAPHIPEFMEDPASYNDEEIYRQLKGYGKLDDECLQDDDFKAFYYPIMRNEFSINYRLKHIIPREKSEHELVLVHGKQDNHVSYENLQAWQEYTHILVDSHQVDGGHFFEGDINKLVTKIISSSL